MIQVRQFLAIKMFYVKSSVWVLLDINIQPSKRDMLRQFQWKITLWLILNSASLLRTVITSAGGDPIICAECIVSLIIRVAVRKMKEN